MEINKMYVTPTMLRGLDACEPQQELFGELFPEGIEITEELCLKHAADFSWDWAAKNLLPPAGYEEYRLAGNLALASFKKLVAKRGPKKNLIAFASTYQASIASAFARIARAVPSETRSYADV